MRKQRFKEIQGILSQENIGSQEILLSKLNESGINITQATLSRDLAYLKVSKVFIPNKGFIYLLPHDLKKIDSISYPLPDNMLGVLSIKFSLNIAIVHTLPGFATHICVNIDRALIPECIGTVAGDDTIIIVIDENVTQEMFRKVFLDKFPELKDRI
ncbi:MAG: arginine repressor [Ignavibacteria bacterium]|nr:arginine repressor [Ignavibacteria bacterium]